MQPHGRLQVGQVAGHLFLHVYPPVWVQFSHEVHVDEEPVVFEMNVSQIHKCQILPEGSPMSQISCGISFTMSLVTSAII